MPLPIVAGLVGVVGAGFAKAFAVGTAKFIAMRVLLYTLFTLILPVILYNVFTRIMSEMIGLATTEVQGAGFQATVIQLTGMGGWLGVHLKVSESLSIILSAVGLSFTLRMLGR